MTNLQMIFEVLFVNIIFGAEGALDVPGDVLLVATIPAKTRLLMGNTVLFGIELFVAILAVHNVEQSQNTVLLASTQAGYKAPHSTVRESVSSQQQ